MDIQSFIEKIGPLGVIILGLATLTIVGTLIWMLVNPILAKIGYRNIFRRFGTTILVMIGSLVGTALITGSLVINDSFSITGRNAISSSLGEIDAVVEPAAGSVFTKENTDKITENIEKSDKVDDTFSLNIGSFSIQKVTKEAKNTDDNKDELGLLEPSITIISADWEKFNKFGSDSSLYINLVEPLTGEVYLNKDVAKKIEVAEGDIIQILTYAKPESFKISKIIDEKGVGGFHNLMSPGNLIINRIDHNRITFAQNDTYNSIFISAKGGLYPENYKGSDFEKEIKKIIKDEAGFSDEQFRFTELKDQVKMLTSGNGLGDVFLILSIFGIIAGGLLIINIYLMLAEERKKEMGILRAVAVTRSGLLKIFTFEGFFYSLFSSILGVGVGVLIGKVIVDVITNLLTGLFSDFSLLPKIFFGVEPITLVIGFSAGFLITFLTVVIASFFISRLNIVSAIRDIKEEKKQNSLVWDILLIVFLAYCVLNNVATALLASTIEDFIKQQGFDIAIAGFLIYQGVTFGVIFGVILVNKILSLFNKPRMQEVIARIVYSVSSIGLFIFTIYSYSAPEFKSVVQTQPSFFFVTGLVLVLSASLFFIYNIEIVLGISRILLIPFRRLVPVVEIALRYPAEKKTQMGLTVIMFSLILFMMTYISISSSSGTSIFVNIGNNMLGGYKVGANITRNDSYDKVSEKISQFDEYISEKTEVDIAYLKFPDVKLKVNENSISLGPYFGTQPDGTFVDYAADVTEDMSKKLKLEFDQILPGLKEEDVFDELQNRDDTVILNALYSIDSRIIQKPEWKVGDKIKIQYVGTNVTAEKQIIAIVSQTSFGFQIGNLIFSEKSYKNDYIKFAKEKYGDKYSENNWKEIPEYKAAFRESNILFNFKEGTKVGEVTKEMKKELAKVSFTGLLVIDEFIAMFQIFLKQAIYMMQGFLAFGLIVGLSGLAVIVARSVTERKQQIGMLRSLGFTRLMILQSFIIESSVIALLGIFIGIAAGSIGGINYFINAKAAVENMDIVYPTVEILVLGGGVYIASILFTILPALRASAMQPVEATSYVE